MNCNWSLRIERLREDGKKYSKEGRIRVKIAWLDFRNNISHQFLK